MALRILCLWLPGGIAFHHLCFRLSFSAAHAVPTCDHFCSYERSFPHCSILHLPIYWWGRRWSIQAMDHVFGGLIWRHGSILHVLYGPYLNCKTVQTDSGNQPCRHPHQCEHDDRHLRRYFTSHAYRNYNNQINGQEIDERYSVPLSWNYLSRPCGCRNFTKSKRRVQLKQAQ